MKRIYFYLFLFFSLSIFFSCDRKKTPPEFKGQITHYSKNGISRMDTITKYMPNQSVRIAFGMMDYDHLAHAEYPFHAGSFYSVDGVEYRVPYQSVDTCGFIGYNGVLTETTVTWLTYSYLLNKYVPFVDGASPCKRVTWVYDRKGRKGAVDLVHVTPESDVYRIEIR